MNCTWKLPFKVKLFIDGRAYKKAMYMYVINVLLLGFWRQFFKKGLGANARFQGA
jgi:hypothetical protein